jgi:hypothetical protein
MPEPADGRAPTARRLVLVVLAIASAVAGFAVAGGAAPTDAAWVASSTYAVAGTAAVPTAPTGLTCGAGSGSLGTSIPFTWTAPAGTAPSGYTLKWTGGATGSATFATTSGTVPSSGVIIGNLTVRVYADYGSSWQSVAGTQARTVTSILFGTLWSCS